MRWPGGRGRSGGPGTVGVEVWGVGEGREVQLGPCLWNSGLRPDRIGASAGVAGCREATRLGLEGGAGRPELPGTGSAEGRDCSWPTGRGSFCSHSVRVTLPEKSKYVLCSELWGRRSPWNVPPA